MLINDYQITNSLNFNSLLLSRFYTQSDYVFGVDLGGFLRDDNGLEFCPSIILESDVVNIVGEGTFEKPYTIG